MDRGGYVELDDLSSLNNEQRFKLARIFLLKCVELNEFKRDYLIGLDSLDSLETLNHMFQNGCSNFEKSSALYFYYLRQNDISGVLDFMEDYCPRYQSKKLEKLEKLNKC